MTARIVFKTDHYICPKCGAFHNAAIGCVACFLGEEPVIPSLGLLDGGEPYIAEVV